MTRFDYKICIQRPLSQVYALARQVERQPEFVADYLSCKVLDKKSTGWLLERSAIVRGHVVHWKSWVRFSFNEGLYFTHEGGRLHGMEVSWQFSAVDSQQTLMTITQQFHVQHWVPGLGIIWERVIFGPQLKDIAQRVIQSFKQACETHRKYSTGELLEDLAITE